MARRHTHILQATAAAVLVAAQMGMAQQGRPAFTHHSRDVVRNGGAQRNGRLPADTVLQLDLVLPVSDKAGLDLFVEQVSDPASPIYRQFLTPSQFTDRFGPSEADYQAVLAFAQTHGLTVVGGSRGGMDVQVKGTVSAIESAFHVNMATYQHPTENRTFYSTDREPTVDLPFALWHVSGLDNYSIPHPLLVKKSDVSADDGAQAAATHATTGSGPSASFLGSDMRAAYYGNGGLTGAGQNLGLWEFEGTDLADLNTYYKNVKQTLAITPVLLSVDGTSTSCVYSRRRGCDDTEQTLDMTQALGMAPGLASLTMYIGSSDTAIASAMTTHTPLPMTIGCSWGWTPADPSTLDIYFEKMASQGQTFFAASGDSSTWSRRVEAWPADDDYVVSVGGTDLTTTGAAGAWASETAWADSGGGISPDKIALPSWQRGIANSANHASTVYRNGPDVSANANFTFYVCADQTTCTANGYGGTSFAAPMWAGLVALANQKRGTGKGVGFINPTLYGNPSYLHDITSGTSGSYSAVVGYDLVTGLGSPTAGLIGLLAP